MKQTKYRLDIELNTPLLGSQPGHNTPAQTFLKNKALEINPDIEGELDEESKTLEEAVTKGATIFHKIDNKAVLFNYHIKGLLKECGEFFNGVDLKQVRSKLDNSLFVGPRIIPLQYEGEITYLERPLKAMTMQGPRVSLAISEMIQPPIKLTCELTVIENTKYNFTEEMLREFLDYSKLKGMGQWRNSGFYGQFEYSLEKLAK